MLVTLFSTWYSSIVSWLVLLFTFDKLLWPNVSSRLSVYVLFHIVLLNFLAHFFKFLLIKSLCIDWVLMPNIVHFREDFQDFESSSKLWFCFKCRKLVAVFVSLIGEWNKLLISKNRNWFRCQRRLKINRLNSATNRLAVFQYVYK